MSTEFPKVQEDEIVTPVMDGYHMKCCDCDLIHTFRFRAIRVTERLPDGTFNYEELDPTEYRVQLIAQRPEKQPPWPAKPWHRAHGVMASDESQQEQAPGRDPVLVRYAGGGKYVPACEPCCERPAGVKEVDRG